MSVRIEPAFEHSIKCGSRYTLLQSSTDGKGKRKQLTERYPLPPEIAYTFFSVGAMSSSSASLPSLWHFPRYYRKRKGN